MNFRSEQLDKTPETRPVIQFAQMRDFVRDHIIKYRRRGQDQPPGKRQTAR